MLGSIRPADDKLLNAHHYSTTLALFLTTTVTDWERKNPIMASNYVAVKVNTTIKRICAYIWSLRRFKNAD